MNVHRIQADLQVAEKVLNGESEERSCSIDVAAHLVHRAVREGVKYMLHAVHGMDFGETRKIKDDVPELFKLLERKNPDFSSRYSDLKDMVPAVSRWSSASLHEDGFCSSRTEAAQALRIARRLCRELAEIERNAERAAEDGDGAVPGRG